MIDFSIYKYNYNERIGNLDKEAAGEVKSEKHFPIFEQNGKKKIFKPLSKTKPLTTPLFAYSEVFWSTIINRYFDSNAPVYSLAICQGIEQLHPKYYERGTVVDSIVKEGEELVNLFEFFRDNRDPNVDIDKYINYCEMFYDYSFFFETDFFKNNKKLSEGLAKQILLSILRGDQNFHYENASFISDGAGSIVGLAPPIDHEFSTMFMYPDDKDRHAFLYEKFKRRLSFDENHMDFEDSLRALAGIKNTIIQNLDAICKCHPEMVGEFISQLADFLKNFKKNSFPEKNEFYVQDNGFMVPFNSRDWETGELEFKKGKIKEAEILRASLIYHDLNLTKFNNKLKEEVLETSKILTKQLERRI